MILETKKVLVLTVLWDLPRTPLQEKTHAPASRLDQLDGPGVGHVPGGLSIDLDYLVPNLEVRKCETANKHSNKVE